MDERSYEEWNRQVEEESRRVQQELEEQLREFGDTMSDAFTHGFDGMGQDIGDAAWDVGRAAADAAKVNLNRVKNLFNGDGAKQTPAANLRASAQKRKGAGIAMMATGGFFAFSFGIGGIMTLAEAASLFYFEAALGVTGGLLLAATAGFLYMMYAGWQRIKAGRWLNRCADTVEGMDAADGVSLGLLAEDSTQKPQKILKKVRKYIQKGWLPAWLDEQTGKLYLTAQDYRAAQDAKRAPKPEPAAQTKQTPVNLETARRFAAVLEQEKALMRDEQAAEELEHMRTTTLSICEWLENHPEALPKTRRFAEYYIPTTLKLLHTYNDVQGQKGENAEAIRRDIAGILHTLNQAYDNLYDQLLSDTALDVSSEIAALEGMLANDGLTEGGLR